MLPKLLVNFGWWVNRKDSDGRNVFSGGFLGLDNISPIDRSVLPPGEALEQSDATGWMARYCLDLLHIALLLAERDAAYAGLAAGLATHFAMIASAIDELWDEGDGFYYDRLRFADGSSAVLRVHSAVGLIPLLAAMQISAEQLERFTPLADALDRLERQKPHVARTFARATDGRRVLTVVAPDRLERILSRVLDEDEFLSPYGLRSLSRYHERFPFELVVNGVPARVDYEPAESTTPLFGGNSNWRGPIWMPLNYLAVEALRAYHTVAGRDLQVELPTRSGNIVGVAAAADELARRVTSIFLAGEDGRRPVLRSYGAMQDDSDFRPLVPFHEYFHADTGAGLGASHQTGWTGLVAMLLTNTTALRPPARKTPPPTAGSPPASEASPGKASKVPNARRHSPGGSPKASSSSSMFRITCTSVSVNASTRDEGSFQPGASSRQPCQRTSPEPRKVSRRSAGCRLRKSISSRQNRRNGSFAVAWSQSSHETSFA